MFTVILCITIQTYAQPNKNYRFDVGDKLPKFKLKNLDRETISSDSFKGRVLFINFWFTTCPPCKDEIPDLNKLKEHYGNRVQFISITFNSAKKVEKFLTETPYDFTHFPNAKTFISYMNISSFPTNVIVDERGVIRHISIGTMKSEITLVDGQFKFNYYPFLEQDLLRVLNRNK